MMSYLLHLKDALSHYITDIRVGVNDKCADLEPWQIIVCSAGTTLVVAWLWDFTHQSESVQARIKTGFFRNLKNIPIVRRKINAELEKSLGGLEKELIVKGNKGMKFLQTLPEKGLAEEKLLEEAGKYKQLADSTILASGAIYGRVGDTMDVSSQVYRMFAEANPLHPDLFPDTRKMEAEVVRMVCNMFHGNPESCGAVTSGGTESLLLCCLAYRSLAYERGVKYPEIIAPTTVHAGFNKAAYYFRMKLTLIPVDPQTMTVDVRKMRRAIGRNTCMLVGSAPPFPHGVMDPIEDIAELGRRYGIPVHVDACLGGFLIAFMEKAGFRMPPFDFSVPGVTSISADTHKYGFAPKGTSVIVYSEKKYRRAQFYCTPDWVGGIYATPTLSGSRAGGLIAACWAALMSNGESGYVEWTRKIITAARALEAGLRSVGGIFVHGKPTVSVIAVGSNDFSIYRLTDALTEKGYNLNLLQFPESFHVCVTQSWTRPGVVDLFLTDVRACVTEIMKDPSKPSDGKGALYGMAAAIPDRSLVKEISDIFLEACYSTREPANS